MRESFTAAITSDQLRKLPEACVDLIYIDPPFNSNRNYEVFRGETKEKRSFEDRHESTKAYIEYMRPRCVELHRVLKKTGSLESIGVIEHQDENHGKTDKDEESIQWAQ